MPITYSVKQGNKNYAVDKDMIDAYGVELLYSQHPKAQLKMTNDAGDERYVSSGLYKQAVKQGYKLVEFGEPDAPVVETAQADTTQADTIKTEPITTDDYTMSRSEIDKMADVGEQKKDMFTVQSPSAMAPIYIPTGQVYKQPENPADWDVDTPLYKSLSQGVEERKQSAMTQANDAKRVQEAMGFTTDVQAPYKAEYKPMDWNKMGEAVQQTQPKMPSLMGEEQSEYAGLEKRRALDKEEDAKVDDTYKAREIDSAANVYANYRDRFALTEEGKKANKEINDVQSALVAKYSEEFKQTPEYKAIMDTYDGTEASLANVNKAINDAFLEMYADKINNEMTPYMEEYQNRINTRYSDRIRKDMEEVARKENASTVNKLYQEVRDLQKEVGGHSYVSSPSTHAPIKVSGGSDAEALLQAEKLLQDSRNVIEEATKHKDSGFVSGVGRGVRDNLSPEDFTFGISDLADEKRLNNILGRYEKGEKVSDAEMKLLEASAANMVTHAYYDQMLSAGYKSGQVTAESLPFMLEFVANPIAGSGKALAKGLLKVALKKFGSKAINAGTKFGARLIGDALAAGGMTLTSGLPGVEAEAARMMRENYDYGVRDGEVYSEMRPETISREEARGKAFAQRFFENQSEMVFNALGGLGKVLGRTKAGKTITGSDMVQGLINSKGGQFMNDLINNPTIQEVASRTQFHGLPVEYLEEVYNNGVNVLMGNITAEEFTDLDKNIETFLGLVPTSVAFGLIGGGGMVLDRAKNSIEMNRIRNNVLTEKERDMFDAAMAAQSEDAESMKRFLKTMLMDKNISADKKKAALELTYKTLTGLAEQEAEELISQGTIQPPTTPTSEGEQARESGATPSEAGKEVRSASTGLMAIEGGDRVKATIDNMVAQPTMSAEEVNEFFNGLPQDMQAPAQSYYQAMQAKQGAHDAVVGRVNEEADAYDATIDQYARPDENGVPMVTTAVHGGATWFVTANDGTHATLYNNKGEQKMVLSKELENVSSLNAEEIKANNRQTALSTAEEEFNFSSEHHEKTQMPTQGLTLMNGNETFLVTGVEGDVVTYVPAQVNKEGVLEPKRTSPMQMSVSEALRMQDEFYDASDVAQAVGGNAVASAEIERAAEEAVEGNVTNQQTTAQQPQEQQPQVQQPSAPQNLEPIPTEEKNGKVVPQYHRVPVERTMEDLHDGTLEADEVAQFIEANIAEAQSEVAEIEQRKPTMTTDKASYVQAKQAWQAELNDAQSRVSYWNEVKNAEAQAQEQTQARTAEAQTEQTTVTPMTAQEIEAQVAAENPTMTEEEVKEEARRRPLRDVVGMWEKILGIKINMIERREDVTTKSAAQALDDEASGKSKGRTAGWMAGGQAYIYMPNALSAKDIEETIFHEVIGHKGLKALLGEKFDALCDLVWNGMTTADRVKYLSYIKWDGKSKPTTKQMRMAADEYMAHIAEKIQFNQELNTEERSLWDKIVQFVLDVLNLNLEKYGFRLTDKQVEALIVSSFAEMKRNAEMGVTESAESVESAESSESSQEEGDAMNRREMFSRKDVYEGKREWAAKKHAQNKEIAMENGMSEEQADLLWELAGLRHELHTSQDSYISGNSDVLNRLVELNSRMGENGIAIPFVPTDESDFIDIDTFPLLDEIDADKPDRDENEEAWQDWYDENYNRIYGELEDLNRKIEGYLRDVDEKYGTEYAPGGYTRFRSVSEELRETTEETPDGDIRFSIKTADTWVDNLGNEHKGTIDLVLDRMKKMGYKKKDIKAMEEKMRTAVEYMKKLAEMTDENGNVRFAEFNEWAKKTPLYKQVGRHYVKAITSLVSNGDYPINLELTTDCIKREAYTKLLNLLIKRGVTLNHMGPAEIVTIQKVMKQYGIEVACNLCFVEGKRLGIVNWASRIVEDWNNALLEAGVETDEYFDFGKDSETFIPSEGWRLHENMGDVKKVHELVEDVFLLFNNIDPKKWHKQKDANKKAVMSYKKEKAEAWAKKAKKPASEWKPTKEQKKEIQEMLTEGLAPTYINENAEEYRNAFEKMRMDWLEKHPNSDPLSFSPTKAQWGELNKLRNRQIDTVRQKMVRLIMEHPEMRKKMQMGDLLGSNGLMEIRQQHGETYAELYSIILQRFGTGTPKPVQDAVPYDGEVLTLSDAAYKNANKIGGARLFSFSDFDITKVFDYMQMFFDLEAMKQKLQAYTKEVGAVIAFGKSGAKFNISTLANAEVPDLVKEQYKKASEKEKQALRHQYAENAGLKMSEGGKIDGINFSEEHSVSPEFAEHIFHDKERNMNCGAIMVGASVNHAIYSASTDWIRMVIPFHLSGMPIAAREKTDVLWYTDNTPYQSTRKRTKDGWSKISSSEDTFSFYDDMDKKGWNMRDKTREYLAWCKGNGYRPKFDWGINSDHYRAYCVENGYEPNQEIIDIMDADTTDGVWNQYYKFLTDFTAYQPVFNENGEMIYEIPAPQKNVVANFDFSDVEKEVLFEGENSMLAHREDNIQHTNENLEEIADRVTPYLLGEVDEDALSIEEGVFYDSSTDAKRWLDAQEEEGLRFRFIGEKGAANLDQAEEATTRLDNLAVAREMETEGKDALSIKMATGWERGADKKWRYETEDFKFKQDFTMLGLDDYKTYHIREFFSKEMDQDYVVELQDLIEDESLFSAYPELKSFTVCISRMPRGEKGSIDFEDKSIEIDYSDLRGVYRSRGNKESYSIEGGRTLVHEIQHAIQDIEGFASGGNLQTRTFMNEKASAWSWKNQLQSTAKRHPEIENSIELQDALMEEYKEDGLEKNIPNEDIRIKGLNLYLRGYDSEGYEDAYINSIKTAGLDDYESYWRISGEVESRNASRRMKRTPEERRKTLAFESEDVAREDQIFIYDALESAMGSRVDARMAEIANHFDGVNLSETQRAIVDVFGGVRNNLPISVNRTNGETRRVVMRQGREDRGGSKHSLLRHIGTTSGYYTAEEVLIIEDVLKNGERTESTRRGVTTNVYHQSINGVRYTVVTEKNNRGSEVFADFYTNRSDNARSSNTQLSAQADSITASEDKDTDNISDVQEENETNLAEEGGVSFRRVEDKKLIEELEASPKRTGYRNVVLNEDGTFEPPMGNKLRGNGKTVKNSSFRLNEWEEAEEHPELVDENGKITLVKPNGKTVADVNYNPYIHNRLDKVNAQFKEAWSRPNLVYVETEVAETDLATGYRAEKSNLPVGVHSWSNGDLMLSRYDKPVRIIPWEEVADDWEARFKEIGVHFDIVPPGLRDILVERGVEILPPHKGMGKKCKEAYKQWTEEKDDNVMFSRKDAAVDDAFRQQWDKLIASRVFLHTETMVDYLNAVKEFQRLIAERNGIEVMDFEDAYSALIAKTSKDRVEMEAFDRDVLQPLQASIRKLVGNVGKKMDWSKGALRELEVYIKCKHAIERNRDMAVREAIGESNMSESAKRIAIKDWENRSLSIMQQPLDWNDKRTRLDALALTYGADIKKDYGGISLIPELNRNNHDWLTNAIDYVNVYEQDNDANDVNALWTSIRIMNDYTLEKQRKTGLVSGEYVNNQRNRYEYYVPLRGFHEDIAEDVYGYTEGNQSGNGSPIKRAKGRTSEAGNPFAAMITMAYTSISAGNKNLAKQRLYNLVTNNNTGGLVQTGQTYMVSIDEFNNNRNIFNGPKSIPKNVKWVEAKPVIPSDASAEEVETIMEDFNNLISELEAKGKAKKIGHKSDLSYMPLHDQQNEHETSVFFGGNKYTMTIIGNPRLMQSVNGLLNPDSGHSALEELNKMFKNFMTSAYTSKNVFFATSNLAKDALYANNQAFIRYGAEYWAKFTKNQELAVGGMIRMLSYLSKYRKGELDMNNPLEKMFKEFMDNGSATGYTFIQDQDAYTDDLLDALKKLDKAGEEKMSVAKIWNSVFDGVEYIGNAAELCTRFAAYRTSREMGASVTRAVADAKEITVNFNRKGAGNKTANINANTPLDVRAMASLSQFGRDYLFFWNASVQATYRMLVNMKEHPAKTVTTAMMVPAFAGGLVVPMLNAVINALLGDDDEEDYYDLPDYVRQNNICIKRFFGKGWIKIPLSPEFAPHYGMGDIIAQHVLGIRNIEAKDVLGFALDVCYPMDVNLNSARTVAFTFIPSALLPIFNHMFNTNFYGGKVYKEPLNAMQANKPEYLQVYGNGSRTCVEISKLCNRLAGGDNVIRGYGALANVNPGIMYNYINGILGGYGTTTLSILDGIINASTGEDLDVSIQQLPLVGRFFVSGDQESKMKRVNGQYYNEVKNFMDGEKQRINDVKKSYKKGDVDDAYVDEFGEREEVQIYRSMSTLVGYINKLERERDKHPESEEKIDSLLYEYKKQAIEQMREVRKNGVGRDE